jgi:hypothetical protein
MTNQSDFEEFEASELYCQRCKVSQPVRKRLLIILPSGNKYDYICSACGASLGSKMDDDQSAFEILRP